MAPGRPELNAAPVAVMVICLRSCWLGSSRLESPPAWYSSGGTAWKAVSAFLSFQFFAIISVELAFVSLARSFMLEKKAEEADKLLSICVVCVMMLTSSVTCVHLSLVCVILLFSKVATAIYGTLMGPTSLENVSTHKMASDFAMIDLVHTSMLVLWLLNLFWDSWYRWLFRSMRAPWSKSSESFSLVDGAWRQLSGESGRSPMWGLHRPMFFASCSLAPTLLSSVCFAHVIRGFTSWRAWSECMIEPYVLRRIAKVPAWRPWLWKSAYFHTTVGWSAMQVLGFHWCSIFSEWGENRNWEMWWVWWTLFLSCPNRLFFARSTRGSGASINMFHNLNTGNHFILNLSHSLAIAILTTGLFIAFGMGIGLCTMFVVRHGNMTSVRDVVLMSLSCSLCYSNPLRFDDCVLMIFLWTWTMPSFRFHLRPFICTGSPPAWTVRFVWCGDFARHPWGSSHLQFSYCIIQNRWTSFLKHRHNLAKILARRGKKRALKTTMVQHPRLLDNQDHLVVTCFFVSLSWIRTFHSGGFLLSSADRVTSIQGSDSDLSPSMFQQSSMVASRSTSMLVFVYLRVSKNRRYRKIALRNIEVHLWSNMISIYVTSTIWM